MLRTSCGKRSTKSCGQARKTRGSFCGRFLTKKSRRHWAMWSFATVSTVCSSRIGNPSGERLHCAHHPPPSQRICAARSAADPLAALIDKADRETRVIYSCSRTSTVAPHSASFHLHPAGGDRLLESGRHAKGTTASSMGGCRFGTVAFDLHPPLRDSCSGERLALGRDASQQIVPGLGERTDPFFEELGGDAVCVNTGLGEFCQFLAWDRR